ncbi:ATP-NAD kinase-like domain-containing protein [Rhodocollybia butyracea]|uniref:ATP-NAD kinase-like domain-containing protein n=1 Tax=Rhodocollybia butyracea TaxID=206335 RepID=A0A9P5U9S1_9AGAR|nr:ATP-NAD kinase-like domain-containing protein [Rhodocollybia butyracea]
MPTIAIYNSISGSGTGQTFFESHVLPFISQISSIHSTSHPGHAGELVLDALEQTPISEKLTVILCSGDGTLHEIINHLSSSKHKGTRADAPPPEIRLVLVPCGTANALYSSLFPPKHPKDIETVEYKLQSVKSYLKGTHLVPLTLAITTLSPPPNDKKSRPKAIASSVVVSTSLHALILHTSESLRPSIPDLSRFKVAAAQSIHKWYSSQLKLFPIASLGYVQIYDPSTNSFVPHPDDDPDLDSIVDVAGPFAYFLSTVNVDRLEPMFRITPLAKDITPSEATCDVMLIKPFSSPTVSMDTEETRQAFVATSTAVLQAVYQNGTHINLRYNENGEVTTEGDGPLIVEYVRCGGWEWIPDDIDDDAHLICCDGAISTIEKGGRAVCVAATPQANAGFLVHA